MVVVNATPGWSDFREGHYGRALSSAGYAVLAIDTYGPRQVTDVERDNSKLSTYAQALDAFAARKYLISLGYAPDRMAVMGTGRGGTIALLAADRTFMRNEKDRFVLAMSISAGCIFHPRKPSPGSRIFMAIGEKDQISGVEPCRSLAEKYVAAGGNVTVKLYPGAPSGFDGHPAVVKLYHDPSMETFVNCTVLVEPDGRSTYVGKTFAESDTKGLIEEMRKSCIKRGGSGWTNLTQKANVTLDLIEFLDLNFRRRRIPAQPAPVASVPCTTRDGTANAPPPRWCRVCRSALSSRNDQRPFANTRSSARADTTSPNTVS